MKKILCIILILTVLFSSCTKKKPDATSKATQKTSGNSSAAVYTALVVKGNVTWSLDDSDWNKLEVQKSVVQGSFVETGKKSGATLQGSIGDLVQMGELAKVQLVSDELLQQGERVSLAVRAVRLLRGKAKFSVEKGKGRFTVETPSARVRVKGTVFTVFVDSLGKTDVAVIEGLVDVVQLSDTANVNELRPGEVLRGSVNDNVKIEHYEEHDTLVVSEESIENNSKLNVSENISKNDIKSSSEIYNAAIKNNLTPAARYNSKVTEQAGVAAEQKINNERQDIESRIEDEKADFAATKEKTEQEHEIKKAAAEQVPEKALEEAARNLDNERTKSDNATDRAREEALKKMQKERSTKNEPAKTNGSSKASDDAFDELRRRRGE